MFEAGERSRIGSTLGIAALTFDRAGESPRPRLRFVPSTSIQAEKEGGRRSVCQGSSCHSSPAIPDLDRHELPHR